MFRCMSVLGMKAYGGSVVLTTVVVRHCYGGQIVLMLVSGWAHAGTHVRDDG